MLKLSFFILLFVGITAKCQGLDAYQNYQPPTNYYQNYTPPPQPVRIEPTYQGMQVYQGGQSVHCRQTYNGGIVCE